MSSCISNIGVPPLFIGLQVDFGEMRRQRRDIVWLTVFNTALPFLLGAAFLLSPGYGWLPNRHGIALREQAAHREPAP